MARRSPRPRDPKIKLALGFCGGALLLGVLLLVVAWILVGPTLREQLGEAHVEAARVQMDWTGEMVRRYADYSDGRFPESLDELVSTSPRDWKLPDSHRLNDPWDNPFHYEPPGEDGVFRLTCLGADAAPGGEGANRDLQLEVQAIPWSQAPDEGYEAKRIQRLKEKFPELLEER